MEQYIRVKALRESTGMNRREFCDYFQIPYRTVTEWERDNRHAPEYVIRLLEHYIQTENMIKPQCSQGMDNTKDSKETVKLCQDK